MIGGCIYHNCVKHWNSSLLFMIVSACDFLYHKSPENFPKTRIAYYYIYRARIRAFSRTTYHKRVKIIILHLLWISTIYIYTNLRVHAFSDNNTHTHNMCIHFCTGVACVKTVESVKTVECESRVRDVYYTKPYYYGGAHFPWVVWRYSLHKRISCYSTEFEPFFVDLQKL